MPTMTTAQAMSFLADGRRTAKVATVRLDGRAHVAPVWFVLDGDELVFTTGERTVKGRALRRDPRISLCVDDETPPFAFVLVEGVTSISTDPGGLLDWATRIAARYLGDELAPRYGRRNGVPGELLVRVRPTTILGEDRVAD